MRLQPLARRDRAAHVDDRLDREVGDGRLGLGHAPRDDLLRARRLLDRDVALGGALLRDDGRRAERGAATGAGAAAAPAAASPGATSS